MIKRRLKKWTQTGSQAILDWGGYGVIKSGGQYITRLVRNLRVPEAQALPDDFARALQQQGITEADLQRKQQQLLAQCILYLLLGILIFLYGCYRLMAAKYYAFLVSLLLMCALFAFAFRAHFWLFQIRERRLGCSYKEWFEAVWQGEKL